MTAPRRFTTDHMLITVPVIKHLDLYNNSQNMFNLLIQPIILLYCGRGFAVCKITLPWTALILLLTNEFVGENESLLTDTRCDLNCRTIRETFAVPAHNFRLRKFQTRQSVCGMSGW